MAQSLVKQYIVSENSRQLCRLIKPNEKTSAFSLHMFLQTMLSCAISMSYRLGLVAHGAFAGKTPWY
jgi:hypothetical protein